MPVQSTKNIRSRRNKTISLFEKTMILKLTGTNPRELQEVAHSIHSLSHPHIIGGKSKRRVTVTCESSIPTKIFDGRA